MDAEFVEIAPFAFTNYTITSESSIGSSGWGGSGGSSGTIGGGGGTSIDTSNFVVKTGATDQTIEGIVRPDNLLSNGAVVAKSLAPTDANEWPQAGQNVDGVIKYDNVTLQRNANGQLYVKTSGGTVVNWGTEVAGQSVQLIVAAITKTLALASHTHTGYQPADADLTAIAALAGTSGLLKKTAADTWTLDTNTYLKAITKAMVESVLTGNITTHTHSQYLLSSAYTAADVLSKLLTVDGANSGLDADTLDTFHETAFPRIMSTSTNLNDLSRTGMYAVSNGAYNIPSGATALGSHVVHYNWDANSAVQMYYNWSDDRVWTRKKIGSSVWNGWVLIWNALNSNLKTVNWSAKDLSAVNGYYDGAVVAKYLSSTYTPDYPIGSASVFGTFKAGLSLIAKAGTLDQRNRHYTTTTAYTDAAARDITAKIPLGTGNMTSGTLDQIKLDFAPLSTTFGLTANVIVTQTGAGAGLIVSFREDSGTGRWYICIYNPTGSTFVS